MKQRTQYFSSFGPLFALFEGYSLSKEPDPILRKDKQQVKNKLKLAFLNIIILSLI